MHANARLAPLMRAEIALLLTSQKLSGRSVALAYSVSDRTVRRWLARARESGFPARLEDRPSVPHHQPRKTSRQLETRILELRRQRRTYAQILTLLPVSKATLSRILRRHGLNRLSALEPPKPPVIRYERDHPGELLHLDIKKLGRFSRPGVRATGDRTLRNPGAGVESLHVAIDDHSRLAFAALLPDEKIPSVLQALHQAVDFYKAHGIRIQRILTERGSTYRSKLFASACQQLGLKHRFTKPYRPQTNGKAERFIQSALREWAYGTVYNHSKDRAAMLDRWIHHYNWHRPHQGIAGLAPISRLAQPSNNLLTLHS
jgi:transposase InsO family protein